MASPVVAGTAALFLENCQLGNWEDFKSVLIATAVQDSFTSNLPNETYGNGKLNAFDLMSILVEPLTIFGDSILCAQPQLFGSFPPMTTYSWSNGDTTQNALAVDTGYLFLFAENEAGCNSYSDTVLITQGSVPPTPAITQIDGALVASNGQNIQWYYNDNPLVNDTNQLIFPDQYGFYSVSFTSPDGCTSYSNAFNWTALSLESQKTEELSLYPNPTKRSFTIEGNEPIRNIEIWNYTGKNLSRIQTDTEKKVTVSIEDLSPGAYFVKIQLNSSIKIMKLIKQ